MTNWLQILEWDAADLEDLRFVGYRYIKQGKYETALPFFEALVVLSSQAAYDLQTLGALHLQMGNNQTALHYLEQAVEKDPSHAPTRLNHAKALLSLGHRQRGLGQAQALLQHRDRHIASQAEALLLAYTGR